MNVLGFLKKMGKPAVAVAAPLASVSMAFAADNSDALSFTQLTSNISNTGNNIMGILMVVVTIAGIFLVLKGLVHLKQNYTSGGGGQEKHLSKGIASLVFGAALFLVVPITHALVGSVSGTNTDFNSFKVQNYKAESLS